MDNKILKEQENLYLKAKLYYYQGKPIMSDPTFDMLENQLKAWGSQVIKQVGSKGTDYTFNHPTTMLSLSKIQMDNKDNKYNEFKTWYNKRVKKLGIPYSNLFCSPKFDGSAINIVYNINDKKELQLFGIYTRHDESHGKDITDKLRDLVPTVIWNEIPNVKENSILEIRAEVVIDKKIFEEKYSSKYENPRNFVSGILHTDDIDLNICHDLIIKPVHYILDSIHLPASWFIDESFNKDGLNENIYQVFLPDKYDDIISYYEKIRDEYSYQLDGVVISFPVEYRHMLGENDHDPEWCIAIKFIPEEVVTNVIGVEWNTGKTGELTPVVLIEPVRLAGTTVKRTSGYNAGYIIENRLGPGAIVSMVKSGDIIPMIKEVKLMSPETFVLPTNCPSCHSKLTLDEIHLICTNENCIGKTRKRLISSFKKLKLKGVGPATLQIFADDFSDLVELIYYIRKYGNDQEWIEYFGFKCGSKSHENFIKVFNDIEFITYDQVILMLGLDNVGKSLAKEISNYHHKVEYSFSGHDRSLVTMLNSEEIRNLILDKIVYLNACGITVVCPGDNNKTNSKNNKTMKNDIYVCMTGSPKEFGWKTKEEFISEFDNVIECSVTDKKCNYLITDSLESMTSKMQKAQEKCVEIVTYKGFYNMYSK